MNKKVQPGISDDGEVWCSTRCPSYQHESDLCLVSNSEAPFMGCCEPYYWDKIEDLTQRLRAAESVIYGIKVFSEDTLSGPVKGQMHIEWVLEGFRVIIERIRDWEIDREERSHD